MLKEIGPARAFDEEFKTWLTEELAKHYRPSRFQDRGADYMEEAICRHLLWLYRYGWTALSRHDELTGKGREGPCRQNCNCWRANRTKLECWPPFTFAGVRHE